MSTFTSLPWEIFSDILIRLTVKDILRCRSVCKEWHATINGRDFIKWHLKHCTSAANSNLSLVLQRQDSFYWRDFGTPGPATQLKSIASRAMFHVLGSCNGLVALGSLSGDTILWNPSTRKQVKLPDPPRSKSLSILIGFGYDSVNDDYKLLRTMNCGWDPNPFRVEVMIYSLNAKTWKKAGYLCDSRVGTHSCWLCVHSGNSLYWIVRRWQGLECNGDSKSIVAFDLVTEQCRDMSLPDHDHNDENLHVKLGNLEGFGLSVMALKNNPDLDMLERVEAWVMMKDSWTKLFYVEPCSTIGVDFDPAAHMVSSDQLLLYLSRNEFILFDPETTAFSVLSLLGCPTLREARLCVRSLVGIDDSDWKDSEMDTKKEKGSVWMKRRY